MLPFGMFFGWGWVHTFRSATLSAVSFILFNCFALEKAGNNGAGTIRFS
jgi:hypothetical protein